MPPAARWASRPPARGLPVFGMGPRQAGHQLVDPFEQFQSAQGGITAGEQYAPVLLTGLAGLHGAPQPAHVRRAAPRLA